MYDFSENKERKNNMFLRVLRTTSFRFAMITVTLFMMSVMLLGAFTYRATIGAGIKNVESQIEQEFEDLHGIYNLTGYNGLRGNIKLRTDRRYRLLVNPYSSVSLYIFIDATTKDRVIRDLEEVPTEALERDGIVEFPYRLVRQSVSGDLPEVEEYETRYAVGRLEKFYNPVTEEPDAIIFLARDITDLVSIRSASREVIVNIALVTIILAIILAIISSRAFLARIDRVNRTTEAIQRGDLSRRIPLTGGEDEFDSLAINLNAMLDQIERLMGGMRQVSDNIAHDLRSPLTRIRARLESALNEPEENQWEVLQKTALDVDRLLATFNALLAITRIESGERDSGNLHNVDLKAVAEEVTELYEPAAEDAGFELELDLQDTPPVSGSRELISQALSNLLDNAFKYARHDVSSNIQPRIRVRVAPGVAGGAFLSVEDNGPGVPEADRDRILKRFVRLEQSRSTQGNGLGLSMVAAIARFHNGQLSVGPGLSHASERTASTIAGESGQDTGLGLRLAFPALARKAVSNPREATANPKSE